MTLKRDLSLIIRPYYLINLFLSLSYIVAKKIPGLCEFLFPRSQPLCELDGRETEILFFLMIVIMIRTRKTGSTTMLNYLSSSFVYCKVANSILWFYADFRMGFLYTTLFILLSLILSEPTYSGPDNVTYFRTAASLEDELNREKKVVWLIAYYTVWNPACVNFAPVFAKLSSEYGLETLRFGKIDIGRYPEAAHKWHINDSSLSKQLPSIIMFKEGKEFMRRPMVDHSGKLHKFFFTEDNIKASFDLNNLYIESRNNPLKTKKKETKDKHSELANGSHQKSE